MLKNTGRKLPHRARSGAVVAQGRRQSWWTGIRRQRL